MHACNRYCNDISVVLVQLSYYKKTKQTLTQRFAIQYCIIGEMIGMIIFITIVSASVSLMNL